MTASTPTLVETPSSITRGVRCPLAGVFPPYPPIPSIVVTCSDPCSGFSSPLTCPQHSTDLPPGPPGPRLLFLSPSSLSCRHCSHQANAPLGPEWRAFLPDVHQGLEAYPESHVFWKLLFPVFGTAHPLIHPTSLFPHSTSLQNILQNLLIYYTSCNRRKVS